MPIVLRAETDLFRLETISDFMVNPCNCTGQMDIGLSEAFRTRFPSMYNTYKTACEDGSLKLGNLQVIEYPKENVSVINLPTRNHYLDKVTDDMLRECLEALKRYLVREGNHLKTVTMPILGCGRGGRPYTDVIPIFKEILDDLDNVIHVCMLPSRMESLPKYLVVVGARRFCNPQFCEDSDDLEREFNWLRSEVVDAVNGWGMEIEDFTAMVSGGAPGTDAAACGKGRTHKTYQTSLAHLLMPDTPPIICKADWEGRPKIAGIIRNRTLADIGTHFVVARPHNVETRGTDALIKMVKSFQDQMDPQDPLYKHLHIFGNTDLSLKYDNPPQETD